MSKDWGGDKWRGKENQKGNKTHFHYEERDLAHYENVRWFNSVTADQAAGREQPPDYWKKSQVSPLPINVFLNVPFLIGLK